ncbi:MAG: hypothetical protein PHP50_12930 [Lachnospiraceae bacterium]|nr:hypothetical protein [Lachnospiraceae bacterium]
MLLNNKEAEIDYLADWPTHYYEVTEPEKRKELLSRASLVTTDTTRDAYMLQLWEKRYHISSQKKSIDCFLRAFMMIKAASVAGISFFQKKKQKKELEGYMQELCLLDYEQASEKEQKLLLAEWSAFARFYIVTCTSSKSYCSTLFGIMPIHDETVAQKLADEIDLVTVRFPAQFDLQKTFEPLHLMFRQAFFDLIANAADYWLS